MYHSEEQYNAISYTNTFGTIIYSDIYNPSNFAKNYIRLDLTDKKTINLFSYQVHAILGSRVFTYDGYGVNFPNEKNELEAAEALNNLLMPGGIMATQSAGYSRFEGIFIKNFGYQVVKYDLWVMIIQKPF
ncbi:hypothetical protein A2229_00640 [Candidatus Peregrinibacteria bacterium RIFOXYA2_FULL_33_7]|nr:MAG: hypothetical protein A2229_00640 [Candidatus Peregrinibacteria bacterium RIFOXYA2_FULL_33_7]